MEQHTHDEEERQQQFPVPIHLLFTLPGRSLSLLSHHIFIPNQFPPVLFLVQPAQALGIS